MKKLFDATKISYEKKLDTLVKKLTNKDKLDQCNSDEVAKIFYDIAKLDLVEKSHYVIYILDYYYDSSDKHTDLYKSLIRDDIIESLQVIKLANNIRGPHKKGDVVEYNDDVDVVILNNSIF